MPEHQSPHLTTTREPRAQGPGPGADRLRAAYLDLLKLTLCDLASAGTSSAVWNAIDPVHSTELPKDELARRVVGQDWPLRGLTMVGLERLDDLQAVIEQVLRDDVPGDVIEAGSWRGGAAILMRATLDAHGAEDRTVWVCDSFAGFPEPDRDAFPTEDPKLDPLTDIDFLSVSEDEVRANFARFGLERGVELVPGFFEDTLPYLEGGPLAVVRLDGDTYGATWLALESLYPRLAVGGYLVVDDYRWIEACRRAVNDFREQRGITEPIEQIDWNSIRWRRESEPEAGDHPEPPALSEARTERRAPPRREAGELPTRRELDLRRELEALGGRLSAAEVELARLQGSPLAGPIAWARRRLGR